MTVCIAAICTWASGQQMIVGASDRMLTAGDVEFEPPMTKIFPLGTDPLKNQFVALMAGSAPAQATIALNTQRIVAQKGVTEIRDVAEICATEFAEYRRKDAEQNILAPLGLTLQTFLTSQKTMSRDLVLRLTPQLQEHEISVETIVAGMDPLGAHLYVIRDPGTALCYDSVAFASIGVGSWHAQSQFMFASYTGLWTFARALFLTYAAKKRAEVAPGVGAATDMFYIGPGAGPFGLVFQPVLENIDRIYRDTLPKWQTTIDAAYQQVETYVAQVIQSATAQPPQPQARDGTGSAC